MWGMHTLLPMRVFDNFEMNGISSGLIVRVGRFYTWWDCWFSTFVEFDLISELIDFFTVYNQNKRKEKSVTRKMQKNIW